MTDLVTTDIIGKLGGIHISKRDRRLIYAGLMFCATVIVYLLRWGQDTEIAKSAMSNAWWCAFGLIFVFVAASTAHRKIAADAVKKQDEKAQSNDQ